MNNIFKLKDNIILNQKDVESFCCMEDEINPYSIKFVINMKSGNPIISCIHNSEFDEFYKKWSKWMNISSDYKWLPKYKIINNETKPFVYKDLIIHEPDSIKILSIIHRDKYEDYWYILIVCDYGEFSIKFNQDTMEGSTPEEREKEARRIYDQLKKWAGFSEQLSSKEEAYE